MDVNVFEEHIGDIQKIFERNIDFAKLKNGDTYFITVKGDYFGNFPLFVKISNACDKEGEDFDKTKIFTLNEIANFCGNRSYQGEKYARIKNVNNIFIEMNVKISSSYFLNTNEKSKTFRIKYTLSADKFECDNIIEIKDIVHFEDYLSNFLEKDYAEILINDITHFV
jgi:hypothetical protein